MEIIVEFYEKNGSNYTLTFEAGENIESLLYEFTINDEIHQIEFDESDFIISSELCKLFTIEILASFVSDFSIEYENVRSSGDYDIREISKFKEFSKTLNPHDLSHALKCLQYEHEYFRVLKDTRIEFLDYADLCEIESEIQSKAAKNLIDKLLPIKNQKYIKVIDCDYNNTGAYVEYYVKANAGSWHEQQPLFIPSETLDGTIEKTIYLHFD